MALDKFAVGIYEVFNHEDLHQFWAGIMRIYYAYLYDIYESRYRIRSSINWSTEKQRLKKHGLGALTVNGYTSYFGFSQYWATHDHY